VPEFEGSVVPAPHYAAWVGCACENLGGDSKENGKTAVNGSKANKNGSTSLHAVKRTEPLFDSDQRVISVRPRSSGEHLTTDLEGTKL
jgi:hypothetical protein